MNPSFSCAWARCPYCEIQLVKMTADQISAHVIHCASKPKQEVTTSGRDYG